MVAFDLLVTADGFSQGFLGILDLLSKVQLKQEMKC